MIIAPKVSDVQPIEYELWLYSHRARYHQPVTECGRFRHAAEAERVGSLLKTWLTLHVWSEGILTAAPEPAADRVQLMTMPAFLRDMGIDPAYLLVTYRAYGALHDNEQTRVDPPHQRRGPTRDSVRVSADRRW